MPARIRATRKRAVGSKQTVKAIEEGAAVVVYVARDAAGWVIEPIIESCTAEGIELVYIDSMRELGEACGIDVGAASAAVLK
ncbi:MAG: ribosomal L7Ae/L30e/S12e/Gadd45 family protein [Limnochordia bacterium]|jgi:large subunit ribosomal protein L7A|nr:50S ribosomal protein L7Ae-like protein [Bacillota bacterium]